MSVQMTSINTYYELKEEGKISERQELAFMTIRNFYEEKGYWPTPKEVHAYLAVEQGNEMAQFEGPNMVKPRITELLEDPGDDYPDLLEKKDESRSQEYIEEQLDDYESKKATPVKIAESVIDRVDGDEASAEEEVDEDSVIVSEDELEDSDEVEEEEDEEEDQELDTGDVIFGGEDDVDEEESTSHDDKEDSGGEDEEQDSISIDGTEYTKDGDLWVSEDGEDYVFPPGKDEDDYDLDEYGEDAEPDETAGQDGSEEKEQKEASLNQY